jgi:hypothetical protein
MTEVLDHVSRQIQSVPGYKEIEVFQYDRVRLTRYSVPAAHAARLRSAWWQLAFNAIRHDAEPRLPIRLEDETIQLGGRWYVRLSFDNYGRKSEKSEHQWPIRPDIALRIFRVPIPGQDGSSGKEYHLGSYIAGALMRSIGGDIFLADNTKSRLRFSIDIPQRSEPNR